MSIEQYSYYEFEIYSTDRDTKDEKWHYVIYTEGCPPYYDGHLDSDEWYDTQQEARFAAIGHITLLENGEG